MLPGAGSRPKIAMPQRTASKRDDGRSTAAAELARCSSSGRRPQSAASATAARKACSCRSFAGWSGSSLHAKCDQSPVSFQLPSRSPARARAKRSAQLARGAPPRLSPVSTLSCTRARRPTASAAAAIASSSATEYADRSIPSATGRSRSVAGQHQPAEQRTDVPGLAQLERLVDRRDSDPLGTALAGGAGGFDHAVAVAVGLDHRDQRYADQLAKHAHVVPDRRQVDDDLGERAAVEVSRLVGHGSDSPIRRSGRTTAGSARATSPATIGPPRDA